MAEYPTGADVAAFAGRSADTAYVSQCQAVVKNVRDTASSYTRGRGFDDDNNCPDDLRAVIITRAVRLAENPIQAQTDQADTTSITDAAPGDWTKGELRTLNRYRRRMT